jgi:hypothetical protein
MDRPQWGGQQPSIPVYIDDAAGPRQILATQNLVEALQQFRQSDQQRTVWADGLCINQAKEAREERVRQVKLMGVIYQKAQHCLIWLGRGPKDAAKYLDAIKQLNQIEAEFNAADVNTDPVFMSPEEKIRYNIPYGQTSHLRGLQLILSSAWHGLISLMPEELRSRWLIGEYTEQAFINAARTISSIIPKVSTCSAFRDISTLPLGGVQQC